MVIFVAIFVLVIFGVVYYLKNKKCQKGIIIFIVELLLKLFYIRYTAPIEQLPTAIVIYRPDSQVQQDHWVKYSNTIMYTCRKVNSKMMNNS